MEDFVPYVESLELEKLDFDTELIFAKWIWDEGPELMIKGKKYMWTESEIKSGKIKHCKAPTFSQAFRWFREKHDMTFNLTSSTYYYPSISFVKVDGNPQIELGEFNSYKEAELACLRKLIQIVKDKDKS